MAPDPGEVGVAWVAFGQDSAPGDDEGVQAELAQLREEQAKLNDRLERLLDARQPELISSGTAGPSGDATTNAGGMAAAQDNAVLEEAIRAAIALKPKGHDFDYSRQEVAGQMTRHMSHTGG